MCAVGQWVPHRGQREGTTGRTVSTGGHGGHLVDTFGHRVCDSGHTVAIGGHRGHSVRTGGQRVATLGHLVRATGRTVCPGHGGQAVMACGQDVCAVGQWVPHFGQRDGTTGWTVSWGGQGTQRVTTRGHFVTRGLGTHFVGFTGHCVWRIGQVVRITGVTVGSACATEAVRSIPRTQAQTERPCLQ